MEASRTTCVIVSFFVLLFGGGLADSVRSVWSNFEIADLDFWRGEAYQKFFEFLDSKGGFYYEVHTYPRGAFRFGNS